MVYGHLAGSRKLGDKRKRVRGNPFLTQAFDSTKDAAASTIEKQIAEGVEQAVKELKVNP